MSVPAAAPVGLRRVLPFRTVVSTSTGLAYAAISLLACVQLATYLSGDSAWIALLIAGLLAALAALCFSELNAIYPSAAAIRQYMRAAFGERTSLTISLGYLLTVVAVIAADSYVVASAITYAIQHTSLATIPMLTAIPPLVWVLVILGLATGANLLGIRIAGLLQDITTYTLLVSLAAISLIALSHGGFQLHDPFGALHSDSAALNLVNAVAVGVFIFSAFEWVTPLAEEVTDTRQIPRGMFLALGLLFVSYALYTVAVTNAFPLADLCRPATPGGHDCTQFAPQMLLGNATLGEVGVYWMLAATLLTGVMTFNGGFVTASRFLYAAAREATLPRVFARLSARRLVPWVAVLALAVSSAAIALVINSAGTFAVLVDIGAVLEALIYAVAGVCVIQLRRRQPTAARSFRIPLGWTLPLLTIVIFTLLGLAAATQTTDSPFGPIPLPLILTVLIFVVSILYVQFYMPRLKAAEAARQQARIEARRGRRPQPASSSPAASAMVDSSADATHAGESAE
jgi:amino acid transporter